MNEEWRDIPTYEGRYMVSNSGSVMSTYRGANRILKQDTSSVYNRIELNLNGISKKFSVHQLVAMAFLGHVVDGHNLVVDHIDNNPKNNHVNNLQIITSRENVAKNPARRTSKFHGVSWYPKNNKWTAKIFVNGKKIHLGYFDSEEEASEYYKNAVYSLENGLEIKKKKKQHSSKFRFVHYYKAKDLWMAQYSKNNKKTYLGYFDNEYSAHLAVEQYLTKCGIS